MDDSPTRFDGGIDEDPVLAADAGADAEAAAAAATDAFDFRPDGLEAFFFDPFLTRFSIVTFSTMCQYPPLPSSSSGCRSVMAALGLTRNAHLSNGKHVGASGSTWMEVKREDLRVKTEVVPDTICQ